MRVDQARGKCRAGEIDRRRAGGRGDLTARTGGDDLVASDEHRPTGMRRVFNAVPHAVGNEQGGGCWNGGLPAARLCRSCARDGRSGGSDEQDERSRMHNTQVVSDKGCP